MVNAQLIKQWRKAPRLFKNLSCWHCLWFLLQLSRIIYLFSSNLHDASLTLSIHTTCARLMLNLVGMMSFAKDNWLAVVCFVDLVCLKCGFTKVIIIFHLLMHIFAEIQVEPIYEKGVDLPSMDEARILLVCLFNNEGFFFSGKLLGTIIGLICKLSSFPFAFFFPLSKKEYIPPKQFTT